MDELQEQVVKVAEPVFKLSKKQLRTCDPKTVEKKYLKELRIKIDNSAKTVNSLVIDLESPKTANAIQLLKVNPNDIILRYKDEFRLQGEPSDYADKRFKIHQFQVALLRKKVIFERNKLKHEEWQDKRQQSLDQSMEQSIGRNSVQLSEYAPYKSPTEMIEGWIVNQEEKQSKFQNKLNEIHQKQQDSQEQHVEQQIKYKIVSQELIARKEKNKMMRLNQKVILAQQQNNKSQEVQLKMKQAQQANILEALKKKEQQELQQNEVMLRLEQLKLKQLEEMKEKQAKYEQKLQRIVKVKGQEKSHVRNIQTERSAQSKSYNYSQIWDKKLPTLISKIEQNYQREYYTNLENVVSKFKKPIKQNSSINQSKQNESTISKTLEVQQRHLEKERAFLDRGVKVQEKLNQQDSHLMELIQLKKDELDQKFERIKDVTNKNDDRFSVIKQQYSEKCDNQMNKELSTFKRNVQLVQQRQQIIEKLKRKRFNEKSKSMVSLSKSSVKEVKELIKQSN